MSYNEDTESRNAEGRLFFAKQPIFSGAQKVWGHEMVMRGNLWPNSSLSPERFQSLRDTASASAWKLRSRVGQQKMVLELTPQAAMNRLPPALAPGHTVLEVQEDAGFNIDFLNALDTLRRGKYFVALDNYEAKLGCEPLLKRADIVSIDIRGKTRQQVRELLGSLPVDRSVLTIAKGVSSRNLFLLVNSLGFNLFQGSFFRKPEPDPGRVLSPSEASKFKLLRLIENSEQDFAKLSEAIAMDPAISYRLLFFLNSAAFSFPVEITSIQHAVVLLGWEQIKNWLRVAILTDLTPSNKCMEIMRLAAQRGKFFELTAKRSGYGGVTQNKLFMLGLFSLLDALLDMPMEKVVVHLPLDEDLKDGLRRNKNTYALWLGMAQTIEEADWGLLDRIMRHLKLAPLTVAQSYYDSHITMNGFFDVSA